MKNRSGNVRGGEVRLWRGAGRRSVLLAVLVLLAAIGTMFAHGGDDHGAEGHGAQPARKGAVGTVLTIVKEQQFALGLLTEPLAAHNLPTSIGTTGRVIPRTDAVAEVTSPIAGRVAGGRLPRLGEHVSRGQVLFRVVQVLTPAERTTLRTEQARAKAELDAAQREVDRVARLEGVLPDKQKAEAASRLAAARDTYDALSSQLSGRGAAVPVTAPISGTITAADVADGEVLDGSRVVYRIADLRNVWVEADVFEGDLARVERARTAEITAPAYPGETFKGTLYKISSVVEPESRTIKALFQVENRGERLKLNMSAQLALALEAGENVPAVPAAAVVRSGGRNIVFVHTLPEEFEVRDVSVGAHRAGDRVEVRSGLRPGDRVVVTGAYQLKAMAGL